MRMVIRLSTLVTRRWKCLLAAPSQKRVRRSIGRHSERLDDRTLLTTIQWDGGTSGTGTVWSTAANWVGDVAPGSGDDAVIGAAFSAMTISSSGNVTVNSVTSNANLSITGGTFVVNGNLSVTETFNLSAGPLRNANVTTATQLNVSDSATLDGVTLGANTTLVGGTTGLGNQVTVLNGLTLANGALLRLDHSNFNVTNNFSVGLNFSGTQILGGTGTVELFSNTVGAEKTTPSPPARCPSPNTRPVAYLKS